jgi:hypothetical protein
VGKVYATYALLFALLLGPALLLPELTYGPLPWLAVGRLFAGLVLLGVLADDLGAPPAASAAVVWLVADAWAARAWHATPGWWTVLAVGGALLLTARLWRPEPPVYDGLLASAACAALAAAAVWLALGGAEQSPADLAGQALPAVLAVGALYALGRGLYAWSRHAHRYPSGSDGP